MKLFLPLITLSVFSFTVIPHCKENSHSEPEVEVVSKSSPKDFKLQFSDYRKMAEQRDAQAQYDLGKMYYNGKGVKKSNREAFRWRLKSAEQGHSDAQYQVGWMYFWGEGVEKNWKEAFYWSKKSADQGNIGAQRNLGRMYVEGKGTPKEIEKGLYWIKKAKEGGDEGAIKYWKKKKLSMYEE